jgi:hypothetical protein
VTELRAEFNALKTSRGDNDPVRLRYIESLLQRADARSGRLREILQHKASEAMALYRQQAASPAPSARSSPDNRSLRELNRLLESLREEQDDPHIAPLEQTLRQQELDLVDAIAAQDAGSQPKQARHEELKAARRFHAAMVRLNADKVVTQALQEVPEDAGPLNPQRLATRSLTTMRDLSPHYLSRFVSYIDTLFWLEQAEKQPRG